MSDNTNKNGLIRLTLDELRQIATSLERLPMDQKDITVASKEQLLEAIKAVLEMD